MRKHQFLSAEWIAGAREIRDQYAGTIESPPLVRMNLTVTDMPFEPETLHAHLDTSGGTIDLDHEHLEAADAVVTSDYVTVRTLFVDQDPQAFMAAFLGGKVRVQGDLAKLLALQASVPMEGEAAETAKTVALKIQEMTAD